MRRIDPRRCWSRIFTATMVKLAPPGSDDTGQGGRLMKNKVFDRCGGGQDMPKQEKTMTKYALYVPLEAKPGKEKDVADFLRSAVPLVNAEPLGSLFKRGRPSLPFLTRSTTRPGAMRISMAEWRRP
jgi:hypothetical protein